MMHSRKAVFEWSWRKIQVARADGRPEGTEHRGRALSHLVAAFFVRSIEEQGEIPTRVQ